MRTHFGIRRDPERDDPLVTTLRRVYREAEKLLQASDWSDNRKFNWFLGDVLQG